jgi:hypothetical protein
MQAQPIQTGQPAQPLSELWAQFVAFLPHLAAGLFIILVGLFLGWLVKRAVIRTLVWLRLDRLAGRVGWRAAFGKGDVRSALYNLAGNVAMFLVILIFADDALNRWGFTALSRIIASLVVYLPNIAIVAVIVGVGLFVSVALEIRVTEVLTEEGVARARVIGKAVRAALVTLVFALALWQLHFARELVLAGFLISLGSIGVAFALGAGLGMAKAIEHGLSGLFRQGEDED